VILSLKRNHLVQSLNTLRDIVKANLKDDKTAGGTRRNGCLQASDFGDFVAVQSLRVQGACICLMRLDGAAGPSTSLPRGDGRLLHSSNIEECSQANTHGGLLHLGEDAVFVCEHKLFKFHRDRLTGTYDETNA
jgi:hypothetical protein